jgi:hypothetical protein
VQAYETSPGDLDAVRGILTAVYLSFVTFWIPLALLIWRF